MLLAHGAMGICWISVNSNTVSSAFKNVGRTYVCTYVPYVCTCVCMYVCKMKVDNSAQTPEIIHRRIYSLWVRWLVTVFFFSSSFQSTLTSHFFLCQQGGGGGCGMSPATTTNPRPEVSKQTPSVSVRSTKLVQLLVSESFRPCCVGYTS